MIDQNGDQKISFTEYKNFLNLNADVYVFTEAEIRTLFLAIDPNGDGVADLSELCRISQ